MMRDERGIALVLTVMALALLSAIGVGLVLATSTDVRIAANAGASVEAFYAAEAALDRTLEELREATDLTPILDGSVPSAFADGPATGVRTLSDGSSVVLDQVVSQAECQRPTTCGDTDIAASGRDRPWGARNPRWRLFSYGLLRAPSGTPGSSLPPYVVTMVADDAAETDADPWRDGGQAGTTVNPGAGILFVRAEAFGRGGAHRVVQSLVMRRDLAALAQWTALAPEIRGAPPPAFPVLQVLAWEESR
jgi:Tfp pilus assembly protein PilX